MKKVTVNVHPSKGHEGPEGEQKQTQYPLYRRFCRSQGLSGRVRKISPSTGIRSPHRPARCESLYQLLYPGPHAGIQYFGNQGWTICVCVCVCVDVMNMWMLTCLQPNPQTKSGCAVTQKPSVNAVHMNGKGDVGVTSLTNQAFYGGADETKQSYCKDMIFRVCRSVHLHTF